jgi:pyruvate dehydrogenase E2 component (dihydrolipoamide acetyltransferase)
MRIPLTRIQKLIGERMLRSKLSKPCFYIESKADVTELMALRLKLTKSLGVKITSNAFFIRVLALAAKRYPLMLGRLEDGDSPLMVEVAGNELGFTNIRIADAINVGFPVHAPQGLVVPVVKDANTKTMAEIGQLEKSLTEKARSNKLTLEQMQGQTIGLSNLGAYGIDSFRGIVAPPASTILCVGNVVRTPVPANGQIVVRKMAGLSLAVDHRIINGVYAAEFLDFIVDQLEDPQRLI